MVVHFDENELPDLVINLKVSGTCNDRIEVTINQQRPPCGDFQQTNYSILELPGEIKEAFTIKQG